MRIADSSVLAARREVIVAGDIELKQAPVGVAQPHAGLCLDHANSG
jgi:hypothetical protein